MTSQIHILYYFQRQHGIDVVRQEHKAVFTAAYFLTGKFIHVASALHTKGLEYGERRVHGQAVHIELSCLFHNFMGIVGFINVNSYAHRILCHLAYGIDDQAVILAVIVGSYHIQAVTQLEQCGAILLIGQCVILRHIFTTHFIRHSLHLFDIFLLHGRHDGHSLAAPDDFFTVFEGFLHDLGCLGSPGTVLHQTDGAVLIISFCQMADKISHEGEDLSIISGCSQDQLAVAEGIGNAHGHIISGQIVNDDLRTASLKQHGGQLLYSLFRMTVYGSIGDHDALFLRTVGGPGIVQTDIMAQISGQHRSVQRTDHLDIETTGHSQQILYRFAVLTYDTDKIPSGFIIPGLIHIQRTKFTETVRGKQHFICTVISHHNLRPVYHGCKHKGQLVASQFQCLAIIHNFFAAA